MPNRDEKIFQRYWAAVLRAGEATTSAELLSLVHANADALDEGALATMRLLASGSLPIDRAFTVLDSAKAIATKQLMHRAAAARADMQFDAILSRPDPGHVSFYLKSKRQRTAIVSFHLVDRNRLAILMAANAPSQSGARGFGGAYYDCIWLDGLRDEFVGTIENYAASINQGAPNHELIRPSMGFIASAIFQLLSGPRPDEVIFVSHKLLHVLPLHAVSLRRGGDDVYLHEMVQSIHYASSFQELVWGGSSLLFDEGEKRRTVSPRFLSVLDTQTGLPGVALEQKCTESYREQLEPKGVKVDVVTDQRQLPVSYKSYIWANWSSHGRSSANHWGDSFLTLGAHRIHAATIAAKWQFDLQPTVVLAACESAIDTSGALRVDEYCGLDLAFRIAGARAAVASLWLVEDLVAALTAMILPAWWFQGRIPPAASVTALQHALRAGDWKRFLLSSDQLRQMPRTMADAIREAQEPFWRLSDDAFGDLASWATFRCLGD